MANKPNIGSAYVQIIPSLDGAGRAIGKGLEGKEGATAGKMGAASIGASLKKALVAAGIGTAVVGTVKAALGEGAKLEQSFGGLDTIYAKASEKMKEYAYQASQMGISANDFAEQAVSMGAALKNSLGDDAVLAAEKANLAISDMMDNAAKMGTSVESLQNAYTGFSRGNFTMLDNLSLGFAGTKEGMQALLDKASELPTAMGREFDISNYGDIVDAIHLVQEEMGLAGVAAEEGAETFSGSFAAMKASASNLLADLTTGNGDIEKDLQNLVDRAGTFLFDNALPMIGRLGEGAGNLLLNTDWSSVGSGILDKLGDIFTPENITKAIESGSGFAAAISDMLVKSLSNADFEGAGGAIGDFLAEAVYTVDWSTIVGNGFRLMWGSAEALGSTAVGTIGGFINGIGTRLQPNFSKLGTSFSTTWAGMKKGASETMTYLSNDFSRCLTMWGGNLSDMKENASEKFDEIWTKIKTFAGDAKNKLGEIASLEWLKMPHISVDGGSAPWGIGGKGQKPSFNVDWYAKGGIFDSASIIGYGVGEAGKEAILPLDPFWKKLDQMNKGNNINVTMNISGADDPEDWGRKFVRFINDYDALGVI